jgi:hypothetical protein
VHQCGKYRLLVGWLVVGLSVAVEFGMGRFTVHSIAQRTIRSPVNVYVKEGETGRSMDMRLKKQQWHIRLEHPEKSAVAEHSVDLGHCIQFHH